MNALIGGITLLAIFVAFMNMGTPLATACGLVTMAGLWLGIRNLRARQRATPPPPTKITG